MFRVPRIWRRMFPDAKSRKPGPWFLQSSTAHSNIRSFKYTLWATFTAVEGSAGCCTYTGSQVSGCLIRRWDYISLNTLFSNERKKHRDDPKSYPPTQTYPGEFSCEDVTWDTPAPTSTENLLNPKRMINRSPKIDMWGLVYVPRLPLCCLDLCLGNVGYVSGPRCMNCRCPNTVCDTSRPH